jgi:DnaJ family protein C protein 19
MRRALATASRPLLSRPFHASPAHDSALLLGGVSVAAAALAARYALQRMDPPPGEGGGEAPGSPSDAASERDSKDATSTSSSSSAGEEAPKRPAARGFGAELMAKRFYRGGFEDKMTRREAALVLGVRESAAPERVRDRHRKMLMLNHPDKGGSTYLAEKVNEAKDFLLKGGGR